MHKQNKCAKNLVTKSQGKEWINKDTRKWEGPISGNLE